MSATIEGNEIVIRLPINPKRSQSGKSLVIATTSGNHDTEARYEGKIVVLGVNAYVK